MAVTVAGAKDILESYFGGRSLYAALDRNDVELAAASNYDRVEVPAARWNITEDAANDRGQATTNAAINYPTADVAYPANQVPTHASMYDAAAAGRQIIRDAIAIAAVGAGERVRLPTGDVTVRLTVA